MLFVKLRECVPQKCLVSQDKRFLLNLQHVHAHFENWVSPCGGACGCHTRGIPLMNITQENCVLFKPM